MSLALNRKNINRITMAAIAFAFVILLLIPAVNAGAFRGTVESMAGSIANSVFDVIKKELTGGEMYKYMTGNGSDSFGIVYNALKGVGMFFVIILAVGNCLSRIDKGHDASEAAFKTLMEIAICAIAIMNLDAIMSGIVEFGNYVIQICTPGGAPKSQTSNLTGILKIVSGLVIAAGGLTAIIGTVRYAQSKSDGDGAMQKQAMSMIGGGVMLVIIAAAIFVNVSALTNAAAGGGKVAAGDGKSFASVKDEILKQYSDNMFSNIGAIIDLLIPWICSLLLAFAARFVSYTLLLEIGIRRAFAPLAVIEIYQDGMKSQGVRYLKKYLATYLKIAIALVSCIICNALSSKIFEGQTFSADRIGFLFGIIALNFTVIGIILKGGEYANDIVGV